MSWPLSLSTPLDKMKSDDDDDRVLSMLPGARSASGGVGGQRRDGNEDGGIGDGDADDQAVGLPTRRPAPSPPPPATLPRLDLRVPDDVLLSIMERLCVEDVSCLSRVSPTFERLAREPCLWRSKGEAGSGAEAEAAAREEVEGSGDEIEEGEAGERAASSSGSGSDSESDPGDLSAALSAAAALALRVPPQAASLLLTARCALFPRADAKGPPPGSTDIPRINAALAKLADGKYIRFLDLGPKLL